MYCSRLNIEERGILFKDEYRGQGILFKDEFSGICFKYEYRGQR